MRQKGEKLSVFLQRTIDYKVDEITNIHIAKLCGINMKICISKTFPYIYKLLKLATQSVQCQGGRESVMSTHILQDARI